MQHIEILFQLKSHCCSQRQLRQQIKMKRTGCQIKNAKALDTKCCYLFSCFARSYLLFKEPGIPEIQMLFKKFLGIVFGIKRPGFGPRPSAHD